MAPVNYLVREMMTKARLSNRLITLVAEVLRDPAHQAIHDRLRARIAGHEATFVRVAMQRKPSLATLAALPPAIDVWAPDSAAPGAARRAGAREDDQRGRRIR